MRGVLTGRRGGKRALIVSAACPIRTGFCVYEE
jgi:hypothetical protein